MDAICRWHHERWDGGGYPDRLKGDEIPIAAQVVALADVYDALTSERCYKQSYSHEKAVDMILHGECGSFNPLLMECLKESSEYLLSFERWPVHAEPPDHYTLLSYLVDLYVSQSSTLMLLHSAHGYHSC